MDRAHGSNLKALCKDTATPYSPNTLNSRFPQECGQRNVFVDCKYRSVMFGFGGHKYIAARLRRAVVYTLSIAVLQRTAPKAEARLEREINHYLSQEHRSDIESGCPVAGFSGDTPRLSVEARSQFAVGLDDLISILAGLIAEAPSNPGKPDRRTLREQAISLCSQMVGALVLSRAVAEPAPALANEVLESSRRNLLAHFRKS
jgi:hypothetical protein